MIFRQKEPFDAISIISSVQINLKKSMIAFARPSESSKGGRKSQVWPSSTASRSRRLEPAANAGSMQEKKINGIKRHFLVDVMGLIICVIVPRANTQERARAKLVLAKAFNKGLPCLKKVLADDGYSGQPMRDHVIP
jgi:Transposase DDE domain.